MLGAAGGSNKQQQQPHHQQQKHQMSSSSNGIACDAITTKLTEVTKIAESLDAILKELQDCLDEEEATSPGCTGATIAKTTTARASNESHGSADVSS